MLDVTKCLEFTAYLVDQKPQIVILNETWLKSSIADSELLPTDKYKIFRNDRSPKSHPPDPLNPQKFRQNGGGVLIAVKSNLNVTSKEIKFSGGAEILATEFSLPNGTKFIVCTCYRVGTLGQVNYNKIIEFLHSLILNKKSKLFIIGDLNLSNVDWVNDSSPVPLEQNFVDSFAELSFSQCITNATHDKGKILDICLPIFLNVSIILK